MTDDPLGAAVTRLERAIARLEGRPRAPDEALARLAARHDRLRACVQDAVARLDDLIAAGEGGA